MKVIERKHAHLDHAGRLTPGQIRCPRCKTNYEVTPSDFSIPTNPHTPRFMACSTKMCFATLLETNVIWGTVPIKGDGCS